MRVRCVKDAAEAARSKSKLPARMSTSMRLHTKPIYYKFLYYTILYCTVPHCTVLYYTILYYRVL